MVGAAAVAFELKTLEGKAAGLESFRGKRLVLNFSSQLVRSLPRRNAADQ